MKMEALPGEVSLSFAIIAVFTIAGALAAMILRNLVHCVLALVLAFTGLAGLYLQLGAQFVGFAQILIYVGAVAILIVFAILLTRSHEPPARTVVSPGWITSSPRRRRRIWNPCLVNSFQRDIGASDTTPPRNHRKADRRRLDVAVCAPARGDWTAANCRACRSGDHCHA